MKKFHLFLFFLMTTAGIQRVHGAIPDRLKSLNRVVDIMGAEENRRFYFRYVGENNNAVYYRGETRERESSSDSSPAALRVSLDQGKIFLRMYWEKKYKQHRYIDVVLGSWAAKSIYPVSATYEFSKSSRERPNPFWVVNEDPLVKIENQFKTIFFLNDFFTERTDLQLLGHASFRGTLEWSECDGCEHGDQLFVTGGSAPYRAVDVIGLPWAEYVEEDCPGTLHPWILELIKLKVPMRFEGQIDAGTENYYDLDDFWMARSGRVTLGNSNRDVVDTLRSLTKHFGLPQKVLEKSVKISVKNGRLTFEYRGEFFEVDLR